MHDNDAQPPPRPPPRQRPPRPVPARLVANRWGHKHLQAGSASFPESGHPEPQRLCSRPGAATAELTARRGRCLRGSPRGSPTRAARAPLLPLFPGAGGQSRRRARPGERELGSEMRGSRSSATRPPAPPVTVAATRREYRKAERTARRAGGWGRRQHSRHRRAAANAARSRCKTTCSIRGSSRPPSPTPALSLRR